MTDLNQLRMTVREAHQKAAVTMTEEMSADQLWELQRVKSAYQEIAQSAAPILLDALDASEQREAELLRVVEGLSLDLLKGILEQRDNSYFFDMLKEWEEDHLDPASSRLTAILKGEQP